MWGGKHQDFGTLGITVGGQVALGSHCNGP